MKRFIAALLTLAVAPLATAQMHIQYAEPVSIAPTPGSQSFDAYGRRFNLVLVRNDRLLSKLSAQRKSALGGYQLLRGTLAGQAGSWVRLTEFGGRIEGAIWDGSDLYAVTRYADVVHALTTPLPLAVGQTVVFRLSDTQNALPKNFCSVTGAGGTAGVNALDQYKTMVGELRANAAERAMVTRQMDVALIADTEFQTLENPDATGAMLAALNIADGIYADQVGLLLNASLLQLVPSGSDPFTTNVPDDLLSQVSAYRAGNPTARDAAVTHLITGKALTGTTLGIATVGGVCTVNGGASLSQGTLGSYFTGLIMAHELGHNLGAVHDGESGSACAGVGPGYIMWPSIDPSVRQFSQCSLNAIRTTVDSATCFTSASVADVAPTLTFSGSGGELQLPMTLTATAYSQGALTAQNVGISFNIPANLSVTAIDSSAGSCTLSPTPSCSLGDIPAGEQRTVTITAVPLAVTPQIEVTATTTSDNDRVVNNNLTFTDFPVVNNADAIVNLSSLAARVRIGDPVDYTITIRSIRSQPVKATRMDLSPLGLNQVTYTPSSGSCTIFGSCILGDINPGDSITLAVHGIAANTGIWTHDIRLDSLNDTDGNNNVAKFTLTIDPVANVEIKGMPVATINVGDVYTTQFTVRNTLGIQTATNVLVRLFSDAWAPIQAATVSGGTCVVDSGLANCQLGDMPVGDLRTVSVTVKGAMTGFSQLSGQVSADRDDSDSDNNATDGISIKHPVDLRVVAPFSTDRVESRAGTDHVPVYSESTTAASNFVITVDVPTTVRITGVSMADTVCQLIDAQHGRCTAATLANQLDRELLLTAIGDSPGSQRVHVAIAATGDADTSDNTAEFDLHITPYLDAGVTAISLPQYLYTDQTYEFETHLKTSYRDVPNANFTVSYPVGVLVTAPADLTGCVPQRSIDNLYDSLLCQMALLPANTDRLLKFQVQPQTVGVVGRIGVQAIASNDVDGSNSLSEQLVQVIEMSDVGVELAATSATATAGQALALPRITLRSAKNTVGIVVKVPIPTFTTIKSVSSGWVCTGTATLECSVFGLQAGADTSFDITLNAISAGTFTSKVQVTAVNDSNASNDSADIAIAVTAATTPSNPPPSTGGGASGGGGGGGGGRLEWPALLLLGAILLRRQRRLASGQV